MTTLTEKAARLIELEDSRASLVQQYQLFCFARDHSAQIARVFLIAVEALQKIADKETAGEDQKYPSLQDGWDGVADFAKEALKEIEALK